MIRPVRRKSYAHPETKFTERDWLTLFDAVDNDPRRSVEAICSDFGISRSRYYKQRKKMDPQEGRRNAERDVA